MENMKRNYWRKTLQITVLLLLGYMLLRQFFDPGYIPDFEAYCPFGGLQALTSFFTTNTLACSMTENQIFMGIVLAIGVVTVGKLFCSFICPIGTFTEWLGSLGQKFKLRYTIKGLSDRLLRFLKYALLFITFYFTVSSSELFCKEYDPFYAIFTWFGHDVYFWYAIAAILITILGAVFIRQFWCKYLCPLAAITNIFANAPMFIGIMVIYIILLKSGISISWIWPLAVITILGFLLELVRMKGWYFPPLKITRNADACTDCKLCDISCPMGIEVSTADPVTHIDCHLCGDCLYACPEKEVLQINKKEIRWLPATATIILTVIGLYLSLTIELPTINMRWADDERMQSAAVFSQSGLKNVKCFGSASSFATQVKRTPGVLGVKAYVQSHSVEIFYDPEVTNDKEIKKSIFSPSRTLLRIPSNDIKHVSFFELDIDKLFDTYDSFYLKMLLNSSKGIYGFKTEYGEPVHATIYFDSAMVRIQEIIKLIESEEVSYTSRGKTITKAVNFRVEHYDPAIKKTDKNNFVREIFDSFNLQFNAYDNYKNEQLTAYRIPMKQALNPSYKREYQFLAAHLSLDSAVVRFNTVYIDKPYADIYFLKDSLTAEKIYEALTADTLHFQYRGGKKGKKKNVFKFPAQGKIIAVPTKENTSGKN